MSNNTAAWSWNGPHMRQLRKERQLTVEQIAVTVGRSAATIVSYEIGRTIPPVDVAQAIADTLNATVVDLLARGEAQ